MLAWGLENWHEIAQLALEHVLLSTVSIGVAVAFAVPIGVWVHGRPRHQDAVNSVAGILYTIPSLALFALLVPLVGLGRLPAVMGLVAYSQLVLIRAVVDGLDAVPPETRDAAIGMGLSRAAILRGVDLPLSLPVFLAGLRIATVTVIGIATIGAVIDAGGLGELILQGIQRNYPEKVFAGAVAVTALALLADAALSLVERRARPWARAG